MSAADRLTQTGTNDAMEWAKAFVQTLAEHPEADPHDPGFMVGWFANAMMAERRATLAEEQPLSLTVAQIEELIENRVAWLHSTPIAGEGVRNMAGKRAQRAQMEQELAALRLARKAMRTHDDLYERFVAAVSAAEIPADMPAAAVVGKLTRMVRVLTREAEDEDTP